MEIADLNLLKNMITTSKQWCDQDWLVGSPKTGAMRWYVPMWDLTLTSTLIEKPPGRFKMFGQKFLYGFSYTEWEFASPDYLVIVHMLHNWQTSQGYMARPVWSQSVWDHSSPIQATGDVGGLEDAITWFKLMKTIDINQG